MTQPPIIEVLHLTKRYRGADRDAVEDVSFVVEPGQFFALLGPNGAGKTTTISVLTTTLTPTSGTVRIGGHDVVAEASDVRQQVGIIFQHPSLDLNLTAEENVRLHAMLYGLAPFRPTYALMPPGYKRQVAELAEVLGITDDMFRPVRGFSGGMKRKLEIIRSLVHRPRVLFLDEPTLGLDPASRRSLWAYLTEVRAEGDTTVFLTTHYLEEAEEADTICIIDRGHIVAFGTPADVKASLGAATLLLDADDREALRAELAALGVPFTETPRFEIELDGRSVQEIVKAIDTPLSLVHTQTPSLEDAYLRIVAEASS